jgi:hypothetical protein
LELVDGDNDADGRWIGSASSNVFGEDVGEQAVSIPNHEHVDEEHVLDDEAERGARLDQRAAACP